MKDYYKILEVEENSTQEQIKKNYRTLSKKYHPDVNPEGAEKFKELAEAYEILGDKTKREQYNASKRNPFAGTEFEGFFAQMQGNNPFRNRKTVPDKMVKVEITPIDSFIGVEKTINYFKEIECSDCNGEGGQRQICHHCGGSGQQIKTFNNGFIVQQMAITCTSCGGKGFNLIHKCGTCGGKGSNSQNDSVKIKLPVGVDNGQYIKLGGYGDLKHGMAGDLILQIQVIPTDGYEKMNNDLIYNLFLNLDELNSEKINIPHPNGELRINFPETFDTSRPLRLKNKGYNGGDMYVKLNVRFDKSQLTKTN
jgi:molecular chaperone DnaJ